MKLSDFLNVWFDETWIEIVSPDGKKTMVWTADYIGGYEPTFEELDPMMDMEIDDNTYVKIGKSPETGKRVPVVCVKLIETVTNCGDPSTYWTGDEGRDGEH